MPPSPRYTVRLPHALDAQVQARVSAGTPFALLIREALAAYLADTPPTATPTPAPTAADSADTVRTLHEQLAALTTRVEILEQMPTRRRQDADSRADTPAIPADTHADVPPTAADSRADAPDFLPWPAQRKLTPRQMAELRAKRQRGVPIKALMQEYGLSKATVHRYLSATPGV